MIFGQQIALPASVQESDLCCGLSSEMIARMNPGELVNLALMPLGRQSGHDASDDGGSGGEAPARHPPKSSFWCARLQVLNNCQRAHLFLFHTRRTSALKTGPYARARTRIGKYFPEKSRETVSFSAQEAVLRTE